MADSTRAVGLTDDLRRALADPTRRVGRYALGAELGRGGMGVVLRAFDTALRRAVAIKMLTASALTSERARARFVTEARVVASLHHPGIVAIHEVGEHQGQPFLVMDLVEGQSLAELLARERLTPRRAAAIAREVATALDHAHGHGLIHRDVKPQNVMIDADGRAHLMDFGLARDVDHRGPTLSGEIVGTPAYMAPEQVRGETGSLGRTTDVWALGVLLYEALTGSPPFEADESWALLRMVVSVEPASPRLTAPSIHPDLETITLRCMEKEPERRYESAAEVAEELRRWLDGEAILARPLGPRARAWRWVRRNRLVASLVLALAVGGLAAPGVLIAQARRAAQAERRALAAAARERARDAWARFLESTGGEAGHARDAARDGAMLAAGFEAVEAGGRWIALAPDDVEARTETARAALELAQAARASEQWAVAAAALRRAEETATDPQEVEHARRTRQELEADRSETLERHRAAIERVLDPARAHELENDERWREALLLLVRRASRQTARRVGDRLAALSVELRDAAAEALLLAAAPDRDETRAGAAPIDGLAEAVERWRRLRPGDRLPELAAMAIARAEERLTLRARRERPDSLATTTPSAAHILAAAQARALGPGKLRLAKLCAESLGHMGVDEGALAPLRLHLASEQDEVRAQSSAIALARLGEDREAIVALLDGRFALDGPLRRDLDRSFGVTARAISPADAPGARGDPGLPTAEAYRERGIERRRGRDLAGAIADLGRAIELDSRDALAWNERGRARADGGDHAAAIADFERALEIDPSFAEVWNNLGTAQLARGDLGAALASLDRAVELDPIYAEARINRGSVRYARGDPDGAIADFDRAIELDPRMTPAWANRGNARMAKRDLDGAIRDYDRAIELGPDIAKSWSARGFARGARGDTDGAIADLDRAIELAPGFAEAWSYRGYARQTRGDLDGAIADFDAAIAADPRYIHAWNNRARARRAKGDLDGAIADHGRAIELAPRHLDAWVARGNARHAKGDVEGAIADWSRALEIAPTHPSARALRAGIARARRRPRRGR